MLIRNVNEADYKPVTMPDVEGATMSVMVGRGDRAPNFALRSFIVQPGGHTPRHSHDYEHEVYIVGGRGTILLDGAERPIKAGDVIYVPADEVHQFKAAPSAPAAEPLKFLCIIPTSRNCGDPTPGS
jgi:quercetin dioxygenase-like cupin family protein